MWAADLIIFSLKNLPTYLCNELSSEIIEKYIFSNFKLVFHKKTNFIFFFNFFFLY